MMKKRKGLKPSPYFWGVILAFVVLGLYDFVCNRGFRLNPDAPELHMQSWLVAGGAALVFAAVIFWCDRYEREPWKWLLLALIWGAIVAPAISSLLRRMPMFQEAPFPEELGKGLFVLLIFLGVPHEFEDLLDGIIYGAMVGVGFAMVEQVSYLQKMVVRYGEEAFWAVVYRRILLTGLWSHPMLTAFVGAGFGWVRAAERRWQRWAAPLAGFALAVFAHVSWNSLNGVIESASSFEYAVLVLVSPYAILLIVLVLLAWRRERKALAFLAEVSTEFATKDIMRSGRARRLAQWKAWRRGGFGLWRSVYKLQRTLMEWAFLRWHRAEGHLAEGVDADQIQSQYQARAAALAQVLSG